MADKHRFEVLDGLRGVAALGVVSLHVGELVSLPLAQHAYLAVDFFFVLSGFVVAHAYRARLDAGATLGWFFEKRMSRLWPLVLVGAAAGTLYLVVHERLNPTAGATPEKIFAAALYALAAAPMYWPTSPWGLYPVNGPSWSLLYEVLANLGFAAWVRRFGGVWLLAVIGMGAVGLLALSPILNGVGAGTDRLWTVPSNLARVTFSMFLGVLIERLHRAGRLPSFRASFWTLATVLTGLLWLPLMIPVPAFYDLTFVFLVSPALLVAGINAVSTGQLRRAELLLGDLSYPLYIAHAPAVYFAFSALKAAHLLGRLPPLGTALALGIVALAAGYAAMQLDIGIQEVLRRRPAKALAAEA